MTIGLDSDPPGRFALFTPFLQKRYPDIQIACQLAPPLRPLTPAADAIHTQPLMMMTKAHFCLVGFGCPKHARWMATHQNPIQAMFAFQAGTIKQAIAGWQEAGLTWGLRLKALLRHWRQRCTQATGSPLLFNPMAHPFVGAPST